MNIKAISIGALGLAVGVGLTLGLSDYLALRSQLKTVQSVAQSPSAQTFQPISASQPAPAAPAPAAPVPTNTASVPVRFEDLPLCDQLDAIQKSGKSVAQFVAQSGRYSEFATQVAANCSWNAEQLKLADNILHPPVVRQTVRRQTVIVDEPASSGSVAVRPAPSRPWNNCNGIQEPGESYSAACHRAQTQNDRTWGPKDPIDRRKPDPWGELPPANGYSAN